MSIARRLLTGAGIVVLATAGQAARAEVSAQTDATGTYLRTVVFSNTSARNFRIWSVTRLRFGSWPLNPSGDASGDLWPVISESPVGQRWPWVVWSHFNGRDFDLVWSRWTGSGWMAISNVDSAPDGRDALDPKVNFDVSGRPHMAWVSSGVSGADHVYLSVFLASRWMTPFLVSDPTEDATNPEIGVETDGAITVSYDTPTGHVMRTVSFLHPATITDDITPFNACTITKITMVPGRRP